MSKAAKRQDAASIDADALEAKIGEARYHARKTLPYFTALLYRMRFEPSRELPTAWNTGGRVIYYNPEFFERLDVMDIRTVILHEIVHIYSKHIDRGLDCGAHLTPEKWKALTPEQAAEQAASREAWLIGSDVELHNMLGKVVDLPAFAVTAEKLNLPDNKLAEHYWQLLRERQNDAKSGCQHGCVGVGGGSDGNDDDRARWPLELELLRRQISKEIVEAASRQPGSVPSGLLRHAEKHLNPRVDWRAELRSFLCRDRGRIRGRKRHTYAMPHHKSWQWGVVLPSFYAPLYRVGVVGDTSGSVDDKQLGQQLAEARGIIASIAGEILWFSVDAAVHTRKRVRNARDIEFRGGGGTDMGAGIAAAVEAKVDVIVVLTDCETPWPEREPSAPVVVVNVGAPASVPEWVKKVIQCESRAS